MSQILRQKERISKRGWWGEMSCYIKAKFGIKTVAVRQQVSRGMWNLVMVLKEKKVMTIGWWHGRGWSDWFSILVAHIFVRGSSMQCTNFLSLSDAWSVIMSALIPVYALGKQGKIKQYHSPQYSLTYWVFVAVWIGWKTAVGETIFGRNCKSNCINK